MANILIKVGQSFNVPVHIYEADTEEDMNSINIQDVPMGSKCHIINDSKWYMLNSERKWRAMPLSGGGVANEVDALAALSECGIVTPAYQDGTFYNNADGAIYVL